MILAELRVEVTARLGSAQEARWLLEDVLGTRVPDPHGECPVSESEHRAVEELIVRRRAGVPLQYVLGHWSFRRLELIVDPRALIPRPETEQLVDVALGELDAVLLDRRDPRVADLGVGSGAIALSLVDELATRVSDLEVWGVDDDAAALTLARDNVAHVARTRPSLWRALRDRLHLASGTWWDALPVPLRGRLDLVVSNPPYVAESDWDELDPEVREHEPRRALVSGEGPDGTPGMAEVARVIVDAPRWLARPGVAVVEVAPAQAEPARALAMRAGFDTAETRADLTGRARFVVARRSTRAVRA